MTPFLDPHYMEFNDRPARLRRTADEQRLARRTMPRAGPRGRRRRLGIFGFQPGSDAP